MVWVIRDGKPVRVSQGRLIAKAAKRAKASAHWHILIQAAEAGLSLEEAAKRAGMKSGGVRNLCYDKLGSTRWPPQLEETK